MVCNVTFNNISVISWQSVLLVGEPEDPDKTTDLSQVVDKLYHIRDQPFNLQGGYIFLFRSKKFSNNTRVRRSFFVAIFFSIFQFV